MNVRRNIVIDKKLEDAFRRKIDNDKGTLKKGAISNAHEEAIQLWLKANPKPKSRTNPKSRSKPKKKSRARR